MSFAESFGVFAGIPNADYHAASGLSSSFLKRLDISPAYANLPVEFSAIAQKSIDVGTCVHAAVLEGKTTADLGFVIKPEGLSLTTKEGKAWREANPGSLLDADQLEAILKASAAIMEEPDGKFIAEKREGSELSVRVKDDAGRVLKARFDHCEYGMGVIRDIKTAARDVDPDSVAKECDERGYALQAAMYLKVAKLAGLKAEVFRFIFVSTKAPYETAVYDFGPDHPSWGPVNDRLEHLLDLAAQCEERKQYPKRRFHGPLPIPAWSRFSAK